MIAKIIALILQLLSRKPIGVGDDADAVAMYETRPDAFESSVDLILRHEGGYVDHPSDPGGRTKYGISQRAYPELDIKSLTIDQAIAIYRRDYWDKCRCDELPAGLALSVFDMAVNAGISRAVKILQRVVSANQDGQIGPKTITAAQDAGRIEVKEYARERLNFYKGLKTWSVFGRGWERRTNETLEAALKLCD